MNYIKVNGYDYSSIKSNLDEASELSFNNGEKTVVNKDELLRIILLFLNSNKDKINQLLENSCTDNEVEEKEIYSYFKGDYIWGGIVGVFSGTINDVIAPNSKKYDEIKIKIQIQSRFDKNDEGINKPYFLSTMLLNCNAGFNEDFVPSENSDDYLYSLLLLHVFKERCKKAYVKGIYKRYQNFKRNDDKLKGVIDFDRHIKLNAGINNGSIAYTYKENSIDNPLNHLILKAYEKLYKKYPNATLEALNNKGSNNFLSFIKFLKNHLSSNEYNPFTLINKNNVSISHPYFTEYEELRKISLKILKDDQLDLFNGNADEINGILFYIPDLWELYIQNFIINNSDCKPQHEVKVFYENLKNDYIQKTYPDYVFINDNLPYFVLDAKFKARWGVIIDNKFNGSLLPDYDKCIRDMVSCNAHRVGVIFPTNNLKVIDTIRTIYEHKISQFNSIDRFYTFPIYIPTTSKNINYINWFNNFTTSNNLTLNIINDTINKEKTLIFSERYKNILNNLSKLR